ncbi:MAG: MFS transporter [Candidatus Latescibacterota bacterium]|nr:MFS transporter [Candidatus Latescibacterota bacterium]
MKLTEMFAFMRGNVLVLSISGALGMFARSMVFPYTPLYIMSLGGQPAEIGIVYALGPLGGLLVFPVAGYLADHVSRARLIAYSGFMTGGIILINVFAASWEWIALARLLQGFIVFHFPATSAIVADSLPPENRGRGIATMSTVSGAAAIFAPFVAGVLLDIHGVDTGMRILYGAMSVSYFAGAVINLAFIKEPPREPEDQADLSSATDTFKNAYRGIPAMVTQFSKPVKALSVIIILCFVANGLASPFWVVYAKQNLGLSASEWGLVLLIESVARSLSGIPAGFVIDRLGRARFIIGALVVTSILVSLFGYGEGFLFVVLIRCAVSVSGSFFGPACGALLADLIPRSIRGRAMAAIGRGDVRLAPASGGTGGPGVGFLITIPLVIASYCGGVLFQWDPMSTWVLVPAIMTISFFIALLYLRDPQKAEV